VDEVVLRDGHLEVTLSEEPDMALVGSAFLVDGGAISWTLKDDTYTVRSDAPLAVGQHTLGIAAGAPFDLAGKGLEEPFETPVNVEDGTDSTDIYSRPDPRIVAINSLANRFTFHGRPVDLETGLYYFRNRYFDPELGRFITADPLGYVDGPSMYQFARYGPFDYTDPLGLACVTQNGGVNWLCDPMNEMELSSESSALQWTWAVGAESLGNSVTDLLFLNIIADAPHGALDPDRTPGERAWSATKGAGITAFNVAGGAVLGKGANLLLRTPAARWFVGRVLGSRPGQKALEILTADVGALARRANPFRIFDDLAGVVDDAIREGAAGIDDLVPRIDEVVPRATGTVWDDIVPTQARYPGSVIPRSFELQAGSQRVWVHGNATEHIVELAAARARNYTPEYVRLVSQQQLRSLQAAVRSTTESGVPFGRTIQAGGWELRFARPRVAGELPALIHAQPPK